MKRINIIGSIITILALGFIVYTNIIKISGREIKVDTTEKPISQPVDTTIIESNNMIYWEWDSVMDSIDMDCGE